MLAIYVTNLVAINTCSNNVSNFVAAIKGDKNLEGKKLLSVFPHKTMPDCGYGLSYSHLSSLAILEANMFVPELITWSPPISTKQRYNYLDAKIGEPIKSRFLFDSKEKLAKLEKRHQKKYNYTVNFYWKNWREDFDYINWMHFGAKSEGELSNLSIYKQGKFFTIYKINN